jgi:hypothetical protein
MSIGRLSQWQGTGKLGARLKPRELLGFAFLQHLAPDRPDSAVHARFPLVRKRAL